MSLYATYGWVFEHKNSEGLFSVGSSDSIETVPTTRTLSKAYVSRTRSEARNIKLMDEVLRRVELDDKGKPKYIVAGR